MKGEFDGLYVTHPPEKHDEWKQNKDAQAERRKQAAMEKKDASTADAAAAPVDSKAHALSNTLEMALITKQWIHCFLLLIDVFISKPLITSVHLHVRMTQCSQFCLFGDKRISEHHYSKLLHTICHYSHGYHQECILTSSMLTIPYILHI